MTRKWRTTEAVIDAYFVPLVRSLVEMMNAEPGAMRPSLQILQQWTDVFVNLYLYFQLFDWHLSWKHKLSISSWRNAWLTRETQRATDAPLLDAERPLLEDIDFLLDLAIHLLMPLASTLHQVPVVHSTHHGVQTICT